MSQTPDSGASATGVPTCYRHPGRETWIRCQRCERPICPDCMREAAVGFQCAECVKQGAKQTRSGQATYGGARSTDPRLTTMVLIGINAVVWLAIMATGGRSSRLVDALALMPGGRCDSTREPGLWYPQLDSQIACQTLTSGDGNWREGFASGAWWQPLTSAFTHVEIWHIATNMLALWFFGPICEQILGRTRFLAVYLVSALGGATAVVWLSSATGGTVGASGALFGLLGAMLVVFAKARQPMTWLVQNLALGVVITVVGWQYISWQGHLGGFLAGVASAAVVAFAPKGRSRAAIQWGGLAALAVVMVVLMALRAAALA